MIINFLHIRIGKMCTKIKSRDDVQVIQSNSKLTNGAREGLGYVISMTAGVAEWYIGCCHLMTDDTSATRTTFQTLWMVAIVTGSTWLTCVFICGSWCIIIFLGTKRADYSLNSSYNREILRLMSLIWIDDF